MNKILTFLISFSVCFSFLKFENVSALVDRGSYTETYYFSSNDDVKLILSGYGRVDNEFGPLMNAGLLTEVVIEEGITEIGSIVFADNEHLYSVTLPTSLKNIDERAFTNCYDLKNITLPVNVEILDEMAFAFTGLENIYIPDMISEIGIGAFCFCSDLNSIDVSDNNKIYSDIDGVLTDKSQQILLEYPIGKDAEQYEIPETITKIREGAFAISNDCNLKSIIIPKTVKDIDENAIITENGIKGEKQNFNIYGYYNSVAETYAAENGFTFIAIDEEPITTSTDYTSTETTITTSTETDTTDTSETTTTSTETDTTDVSETTTTSTETDTTDTSETTTTSTETDTTDTSETTTTSTETDITDASETTTTSTETDTTDTFETTTTLTDEQLPQAGMPWARTVEGLAVMLVAGGTMLVVKSRKNEG